MKKTKGLWKIKAALTLVGEIQLSKMRKASKNCKKAQYKTLYDILDYSKDTVYGKEHHFKDIMNEKDVDSFFELYRKQVPLNDYEDLRPYIERHKNGEENVLFQGKAKLYATTSGTTNEPKWIPYSYKFYGDVYNKIAQTWLYLALKNSPHVFDGPSVSIVGKAVEGKAPDGTLYGSASGITRRDLPSFIEPLHTAPAAVYDIADYKARYYTIMRMGIAHDTHFIITANPSTLAEMQTNANEFFDDYINDVENGTISSKMDIAQSIRDELALFIKPNPQRAEFLRNLKQKHGTVLPKHYWPNLKVIYTWKCGNTKVYFDKIKNSFPEDCQMMEFTYLASEGRFGLVLSSKNDATVLFGHMMYFEFVAEEDIEHDNPRIYQLHELQKGKRYCPIITESAGLYRYSMNDLIEVTGFYNEFPEIIFIQKINGIISITGEKLHERHFIDAVRKTEERTGNHLRFFIGFADVEKANYNIYYEFKDRKVSVETARDFTAMVDAEIQKSNIEYESKRSSNRLKDPESFLLAEDAFEKFKARCIECGFRDGQFKLNLLLQDEKRHSMFKDLIQQ